MTLQQSDSRVTAQAQIVASINAANNKVATVLSSAVAIEGLWIDELAFPEQIERQNESSLYLSDSYQQSYEATQVEYQKTWLKAQARRQEIALLKRVLRFGTQQTYNRRFEEVVASEQALEQTRETRLSYNFLMKRIWTVPMRLPSTTTRPGWSSRDCPVLPCPPTWPGSTEVGRLGRLHFGWLIVKGNIWVSSCLYSLSYSSNIII